MPRTCLLLVYLFNAVLLCCNLCLFMAAARPADAPLSQLAQQPAATERPLSQPGVVYDLAQDQQDFLWLAGEYDGLLRFDGEDYLRFLPPAVLAKASISQVAADQHNNLWVGSWGHGLWRLDSSRRYWQQIALPADSQRIQILKFDAAHNLWIGTARGLFVLKAAQISALPQDVATLSRLDLPTGQTAAASSAQLAAQALVPGSSAVTVTGHKAATLSPDQPQAQVLPALATERIWDLALDDNQQLWVGTARGIFLLSQTGAMTGDWFRHDGQFEPSGEIRSLAVAGQQLMIGVNAGVYLLDLRAGTLSHTSQITHINTLLPLGLNRWLAGTIHNLYQLELNNGQLDAVQLASALDVRSLHKDRNQQVWLASRSHGLVPLPATPLRSFSADLSPVLSSQQKHRLGVLSETNGAHWLPIGQSLLKFSGPNWQQLHFATQPPVSYLRQVVEYGGQPVIGSDQGLFRLDGAAPTLWPLPTIAGRLNILAMHKAADGALWLGLWQQGVLRLPPEQQLPADPVSAGQPLGTLLLRPEQVPDGLADIQSDAFSASTPANQPADAPLWLLSRSGQLFEGKADEVRLRWHEPALVKGYYHCLLPLPELFLACSDAGLVQLSRDFSKARLLGLADGLPYLRVIGLAYSNGLVWVLSRNGLLAMRPDGSDIRLLSPRPGLDLSGVQPRGIVPWPTATQPDQMLLTTDHGLFLLSSQDLSPVPQQMQLHLTEFRAGQQIYSAADATHGISLPKDFAEAQLKFKLLSFQPHLQVRYFFRWQGQSVWHDFGPEAVLTLGQLAPGRHQLEVMAQAGGQQIQAKPLLLWVPVPWYLQGTGMAGIGLLLLASLMLIYHLRVRHLQRRAVRLDQLVAQRTRELASANEQLLQLSNTDSLTGLLNRRALQQAVQHIQAQRGRHLTPLALTLLDIDFFKQINDQYGHDAGDEVLISVSACLQSRLRAQDLLARWGGEEFLLLMPNTTAAQAAQLAEELRAGISQLQPKGVAGNISATFGVSAIATGAQGLAQAISAADAALYQGKRQGRNQVVLAAP